MLSSESRYITFARALEGLECGSAYNSSEQQPNSATAWPIRMNSPAALDRLLPPLTGIPSDGRQSAETRRTLLSTCFAVPRQLLERFCGFPSLSRFGLAHWTARVMPSYQQHE